MRKLLSNICLVAILGLAFVIVSGAASIYSGQWHWFSRSGSILTIAGVILTFRPIIRLGIKEWLKEQSVIDGGHAAPIRGEIKSENQQKLDAKSSQIGLFLAVIGTVIWAYGDLILEGFLNVFTNG